jgi:prefoldin subunit 5
MKKTDFNELKRKIQEIESTEQKIKDHIEELQKERNICKDKCDKVK